MIQFETPATQHYQPHAVPLRADQLQRLGVELVTLQHIVGARVPDQGGRLRLIGEFVARLRDEHAAAACREAALREALALYATPDERGALARHTLAAVGPLPDAEAL